MMCLKTAEIDLNILRLHAAIGPMVMSYCYI